MQRERNRAHHSDGSSIFFRPLYSITSTQLLPEIIEPRIYTQYSYLLRALFPEPVVPVYNYCTVYNKASTLPAAEEIEGYAG